MLKLYKYLVPYRYLGSCGVHARAVDALSLDSSQAGCRKNKRTKHVRLTACFTALFSFRTTDRKKEAKRLHRVWGFRVLGFRVSGFGVAGLGF